MTISKSLGNGKSRRVETGETVEDETARMDVEEGSRRVPQTSGSAQISAG